MIWGFPQPPLRRLLSRFVKVEVLCDVVFLVHELRRAVSSPSDVAVSEVNQWSAEVDEFQDRCKGDVASGVIRDRRYLNWCFSAHPTIDYSLIEVRDKLDGSLFGISVLRDGGWNDELLSVMEWLVPLDDRDTERALLAQSVTQARETGKKCVAAWFPASSLQFHRLQIDHGFIVRPTPYQQVFISWAPGVDRDWLFRNW